MSETDDDKWLGMDRAEHRTDKRVLELMLKRAGIEFEMDAEGDITVEAGYIGFTSFISFNPDGSLLKIEAYE